MDKAEFDRFADEYTALHAANVAISGEAPDYFSRYKVAALRSEFAAEGFAPRCILDFGCGVGNSVAHFQQFFPASDLLCIDVSERSIAIARERFPRYGEFRVYDGERLPVDSASVDLAFAACVFHHIPRDERVPHLRDLKRTLVAGGRLVVFEHNPLNPLTVRAVNTCPFDENAELMRAGWLVGAFREAGFRSVTVKYRLFFPKALGFLRPLEARLQWCPLGAQYSVCGIA